MPRRTPDYALWRVASGQTTDGSLESGLYAENQSLRAELSKLRQSQEELRDEVARLHDTKLFRWAAPARDVYARLRDLRRSRSPWVGDLGLFGAKIMTRFNLGSGGGRSEEVILVSNGIADEPGRPTGIDDATPDEIVTAFEGLYEPQGEGEIPPPLVRESIIRQFHRLYYHSSDQTWKDTLYRGVNVYKCPLDLWIYQELMHEMRPELAIEAGTANGGSAYFLADLCDTLGTGRVVTIDTMPRPDRPEHDRLTYLEGSSIDPAVVAQVTEMLPAAGPVLVILDSDHSCAHVLAELETYAPMVTEGSYLVVEDTNVHGHPALPTFPDGPMEAVEQFIARRPDFEVDTSREKFMVTFNPTGFLRRIVAA